MDEEDTKHVLITDACEHGATAHTEDGQTIRVLPVKDGQTLPPGTELVSLKRTNRYPGEYKMTTIYKPPGPSRTTNKKYRKGWDEVFGNKKTNFEIN